MPSLADRHRSNRLDVILRAAQQSEARKLAELFRLSAGGVADYAWQGRARPGESALDVGARHFAREDAGFSYRHCVIAEYDGKAIAMLHAYPLPASASDADAEQESDPVLRPYRELQLPGSLYLACYAVLPAYRRMGVGSQLLDLLREIAPWHEATQIRALVMESNEASRRLLQRYGFAERDRRRIVPHPLIEARGDVILLVAPA